MEQLMGLLDVVNGVIWHPIVLYVVLGVGILFTIWSGIGQFRALTHGTAVIRGKYDDKDDPGAINHFQALSAALSATVGLGNIGGVAVAVALGGPGAVFWMWMVGIAGMSLKMVEVTLSMLYRDTSDPENPHGGPMFVAAKGFKERGMGTFGKFVGGIFVVTLLISTITGGNMFQSWNVAEVTETYFGIPSPVVGIVLAVLVGMVILGGIKRIGSVAGKIVPLMCAIYLIAAIVVLAMNIGKIPDILVLIVTEAFSPSEATGAFLGGTAGYALLWGMKRALFSSEAGQGSSPIAHSAAKTDEPVREGIVAGLEPFIDTIVVCTLTALVILSTGTHNRGSEATFAEPFAVVSDGPGSYTIDSQVLPSRNADARRVAGGQGWTPGTDVFVIVAGDENGNTGLNLHRINGTVIEIDAPNAPDGVERQIEWGSIDSEAVVMPAPTHEFELYADYSGASLTAHAFDRAIPGLGKWLITLAAWLFALSTMISWSYYGEQGIVYLFGDKAVIPYKLVYCLLIVVAALGFIKTDAELDSFTALGTGVMLWANIPIMLIFGSVAMKAYRNYVDRLKNGQLDSHEAPSITDVVEGKDIE
ncbi:MAG: alanine/glycine:cation symporter family protein [Phycisphaerales bacterium]